MRRTCNGRDPNLIREVESRFGGADVPCDCGSSFDDVDRNVFWPHRAIGHSLDVLPGRYPYTETPRETEDQDVEEAARVAALYGGPGAQHGQQHRTWAGHVLAMRQAGWILGDVVQELRGAGTFNAYWSDPDASNEARQIRVEEWTGEVIEDVRIEGPRASFRERADMGRTPAPPPPATDFLALRRAWQQRAPTWEGHVVIMRAEGWRCAACSGPPANMTARWIKRLNYSARVEHWNGEEIFDVEQLELDDVENEWVRHRGDAIIDPRAEQDHPTRAVPAASVASGVTDASGRLVERAPYDIVVPAGCVRIVGGPMANRMRVFDHEGREMCVASIELPETITIGQMITVKLEVRAVFDLVAQDVTNAPATLTTRRRIQLEPA